ncbi:tetratricopeptide repeat protein [Streptomyces yangpuensis]|uniref:tetratricopeptide repeat protein n=1 Tax=Streptomyces yangpuensis TaxID=1648182 RepID=UPI000629BD9E|nr:tetratricopeptide repeat protein [Streptomyces yangpuensis]
MNVDDLEWQARHFGGLPPGRVDLLLERGGLDLVIRAAAERGEWFCAQGAAQALCRAGEFGRALRVMEPFVATGWRDALWARADILLRAGRSQEALDLVRPDEAGRASAAECRAFAELLTRAGRIDEAVDLLVPHMDESWILSALVEITEGRDRDERMLELIAPHAQSAREARSQGRWDHRFGEAQELQARVLERAGRADEAIGILGRDIAGRRFLAQNTLTAYAELLARHGRLDTLRELAAGGDARTVLDTYARALRDHGRADEAEAVMREAIAADDWVGHRARLSATLLCDGRLDDAIAVAEPGFGWYDCSNLLAPLVMLLDRPEDVLHLMEHPSVVPHHGHAEFRHQWWATALAGLGRVDEAIALAEAHPDPWTDPRIVKAGLLDTAGRPDDAAAELRALGTVKAREALCEVLIRQGRPAEAIAVHPTVAEQRAARPQPAPVPRDGNGYALEPPF